MARVRKNDSVMVITGKDRGKIGKVLEVLKGGERVVVEKINTVKRHTKPTQKNPQGGIVEKELSIHASNVMPLDPKSGERTRVGYRVEGKNKLRVSKKSGEVLTGSK